MEVLFLTAGIVMIVMSLYGLAVNAIVFIGMARNPRFRSAFFLFCKSRTISNSLTCLAFLCWSGPCTIIGAFYLPMPVNVFWGQLAGWGAYVAGLTVDCAIAGNRFFATYFPLSFRSQARCTGYIALGVCWVIAVLYFLAGLPNGCGYIYVIGDLSWSPEHRPCAEMLAQIMFITVCSVTSCTIFLNVCTFLKLYITAKHFGNKETSRQEQQARKLFAQSFTQDCLYVVDMVSCQILFKLNSDLWFQFICMSVVWLSVHVLDGTIMLIYNRHYILRRRKNNQSLVGWSPSGPSRF